MLVLLASIATVTSGAAASAGTALPWTQDDEAGGSLRFYDARGYLVTSGSTAATPFAAYVQASADGAGDDTIASLYAFTPEEGGPASTWRGDLLSGPSAYPNPSAPTRVNGTVLPVVSGRAGDQSLASYIADSPNHAGSGGYAGIYQLRLYTSRAGDGAGRYSATYVAVNGGTWSQVHPESDSTTVALLASPETGIAGSTPVKLLAKLTPATVGGTVRYYDGERLLGTDPRHAIQAFLDGIELSPGGHVLSATFRPETSDFQPSSAHVSYEVRAESSQPTTTTLSVNPATGPIEEGTAVTLTATVDPTTAPGSIDFLDGPKVIATVGLNNGAAAYATNQLKASEHHLGATYRPATTAYESSTADRVGLKIVKKKTSNDDQTIRVRVPRNPRVLGTKQTRGGVLGATGASLITLVIVGAAGIGAGIASVVGARRHREDTTRIG